MKRRAKELFFIEIRESITLVRKKKKNVRTKGRRKENFLDFGRRSHWYSVGGGGGAAIVCVFGVRVYVCPPTVVTRTRWSTTRSTALDKVKFSENGER